MRDMPISKKKGESKRDFISRCIKIEMDNGYSKEEASAICYASWNEFAITDFNFKRDKRWFEDRWLIDFFDRNPDMGFNASDLNIPDYQIGNDRYRIPITDKEDKMLIEGKLEMFATPPYDKYDALYRYESDYYGEKGYGSNSRPFCIRLMKRDKFYTMDEIVHLNNAPGKADRAGGQPYSVFRYRGGLNCKHVWYKYIWDDEKKELVKDFIQPRNTPV